jgi:hypothetical protein
VNGEREEILAAGRAALASLQVAFDAAVADVVQRVEEGAGERLLVRRPGILDAGWEELRQMAWQCSNFEAAVRLLRPVMEHDGRTLGALLKTADPQLMQAITRHLAEACVLPHSEEGQR